MSNLTSLQAQRAKWFLNLLGHIKPESLASRGIVSFIVSRKDIFGVSLPKGFTVQENPKSKKSQDEPSIDDEAVTNLTLKQKRIDRFNTIHESLSKLAEKANKRQDTPISDVEKNLRLLAERINLSSEEENILLFYIDFLGSHYHDVLYQLREEYDITGYFQAASKFLNIPWEQLREKLSTKSVLRNFITYAPDSGFYSKSRVDSVSNQAFHADSDFVKVISEPVTSADAIISRLLGPSPTTELTLEDFAYLGKDKLAYFVETLRGAVEGNGRSRKNASLYGIPGVGKTELTVVIAEHIGVRLYAIGLSHLKDDNFLSDSSREPTREDRLMAWRRAAYLAKAANMKCLFLLDEADDVLRDPNEDKSSDRASKAYLNWLLDSNNIPTIFVTNNIHLFEESTIRRILPTMHVPSAPQAVQEKILLNYAAKYQLSVTLEQARELTTVYPELTSAVIETIVYKTSRREDIKADQQSIYRALQIGFSEAAAALNNGSVPVPKIVRSTKNFDARLNASQIDIPKLVEDFKAADSLAGLSICLYGVQGSGKKTVFSYMAEQLRLKPEFVDYSGLYGPHGFSVATLKGKLEQAIREKYMLIFNDVSRLLQLPEWSKLDSHPFLLAIHNHPLPIGVTVFDYDEAELEPASFFRLAGQFTFASRFSGLDRERQIVALEVILGLSDGNIDKVMRRIGDNTNLVVGDFVRVANQMRYRRSMADNPDKIFEALEHNSMQAGNHPLGFPSSI
jgi:hypothetical protein